MLIKMVLKSWFSLLILLSTIILQLIFLYQFNATF